MKDRPRIKPEPTTTDRLIEYTGWILLVGTWIMVLVTYAGLPDTIPIHYNAMGEADDYSGKAAILTLPLVCTVIFLGLTILNRYPHIFNYPVGITEENAPRQYTNATRMIRYLKVIITFIFGMITLMTIRNASGLSDGLGSWFLPMVLSLVFLPMIYFITRAVKGKSRH